MKIQCDFCGQEKASVFCTADEAALCQTCDSRVHNANKLAIKHPRFSLVQPQFKESPLCDICQIKKALLFCQEHRSLLCRDCDTLTHKTNEHTKHHNRFLLTGVKICDPAASTSSVSHFETNFQPNYSAAADCSYATSNIWRDNNETSQGSTSSISEYLMETLPGWHVDDLFDPSTAFNGSYI